MRCCTLGAYTLNAGVKGLGGKLHGAENQDAIKQHKAVKGPREKPRFGQKVRERSKAHPLFSHLAPPARRTVSTRAQ